MVKGLWFARNFYFSLLVTTNAATSILLLNHSIHGERLNYVIRFITAIQGLLILTPIGLHVYLLKRNNKEYDMSLSTIFQYIIISFIIISFNLIYQIMKPSTYTACLWIDRIEWGLLTINRIFLNWVYIIRCKIWAHTLNPIKTKSQKM